MDNDDKTLYNSNNGNEKGRYKDNEVEKFINNGEESINGLDDIEDIGDVNYAGLSDEPLPNNKQNIDDSHYKEEDNEDERQREKDYDDRRHEDERRREKDYDDRRHEDERQREEDYDDRRREDERQREKDYDDRRYEDERRREREYNDRRYEENRYREYNNSTEEGYTSLKDEIDNLGKEQTKNNKNNKKAEGKKAVKNKKRKSNFSVFMGFVAVIAIIAFTLTLTLVIKAFRKDGGNNSGVVKPPTIATMPSKADKITNTKAIIMSLESDKNLKLYDFQNGQIIDVIIDKNTKIKDNYNKNLVAKELKVGDIADVEFYTLEKNIIDFQISSDIWEKKNVNNVSINSSAETISIGDSVYDFDERIITTYKGAEVELSNLSKSDVITAKGYSNSILYIEIVKSHGIVEIANKNLISEGTLEIGTIFFTKLDESKGVYDVPEGKYHVIVKGVNIENYSKEIEVKEGQKTIVDLQEVQIKSGALSVKLDPQDATLTINNEVKSAAQPIVLDYGKHIVKASKEGYREEEIEVNINQPLVNVEFKLEDLIIYGMVNVNTNPAGADVYIDDVNYGKSPISENIPVGTHVLTVRKDGYEDLSSPINVLESGLNIDLSLTERTQEPPTIDDDIDGQQEELEFPDDNTNPYG